MKLIQSYFFTNKEFELLEKGLRCRESTSLFNNEELEIPYDSIYYKKYSKRARVPKWVYWIASLVVLFVMKNLFDIGDDIWLRFTLLLVSAGIIFWVATVFGKKEEILLETTLGQIIIFAYSPSKEIVDSFIDELNKTLKSFYIKKYATYDKDLPIEPQLAALAELKKLEVLDETEYEGMKDVILGRKTTNPIGFK